MNQGAIREFKDYLPGRDKLMVDRVVTIGPFSSSLSFAEWRTITRRLSTNWSFLIVDFSLAFGVTHSFVRVVPLVPIVPGEVLHGLKLELDVQPVV